MTLEDFISGIQLCIYAQDTPSHTSCNVYTFCYSWLWCLI